MNSHKALWAIPMLLIVGLALGACGAPSTPAPTDIPPTAAPAPTEAPSIRIAMGLNGVVDDGGWNALHYKGLQRAQEELGAEISWIDKVEVPQMENVLRDYCSQGYDLVFGPTFAYGDPALKVAQDFPDCKIVVTSGIVEGPSVVSFWPREVENHYLSGVLSALMTESNQIAAIGGVDLANMRAKMHAIEAGARLVKPDVEFTVTYVGSWSDPALGSELAQGQIGAGVDVIDTLASVSGLGAIQAAEEKNVWAINDVILDPNLAPTVLIAAHVQRFDEMVLYFARQVQAGEFEGQAWRPGLDSGMIDLEMSGLVPADVQSQVMEVRQKIIDGEITVEEVFE